MTNYHILAMVARDRQHTLLAQAARQAKQARARVLPSRCRGVAASSARRARVTLRPFGRTVPESVK